jgi:hypothetical protein
MAVLLVAHNGDRVEERTNHGAPSGVKPSAGSLPHKARIDFDARVCNVGQLGDFYKVCLLASQ